MAKPLETKLKDIIFRFDEENKELIIEKDKVFFVIPRRYLYSLRVFIARIYKRGFYKGKGVIKNHVKFEKQTEEFIN